MAAVVVVVVVVVVVDAAGTSGNRLAFVTAVGFVVVDRRTTSFALGRSNSCWAVELCWRPGAVL